VIFKPYYYFETGCAAYLFGCGGLGKCAVVDAHEDDVDAYARSLRRRTCASRTSSTRTSTPITARAGLRSRRRSARLLPSRVGRRRAAVRAAARRQEIELGNTRVKVLHTPGHTPESICLVVTDLRRGTDPWFVLTGDTLFVGAVGRPDLPGPRARERRRAPRQHPREAPHAAGRPRGLPGHFAGSVCGVGMSGKPSSTIAFEKRWNPLLEVARRVRRCARRRPAEARRDGADPAHQPGPRGRAVMSSVRLGLRENLGQFSLLVVVNAFVGAMVGMERTILPPIAEQEFHLAARRRRCSRSSSCSASPRRSRTTSPGASPTASGASTCSSAGGCRRPRCRSS
jgi:hydroxyacylglutathione hydrolase